MVTSTVIYFERSFRATNRMLHMKQDVPAFDKYHQNTTQHKVLI